MTEGCGFGKTETTRLIARKAEAGKCYFAADDDSWVCGSA